MKVTTFKNIYHLKWWNVFQFLVAIACLVAIGICSYSVNDPYYKTICITKGYTAFDTVNVLIVLHLISAIMLLTYIVLVNTFNDDDLLITILFGMVGGAIFVALLLASFLSYSDKDEPKDIACVINDSKAIGWIVLSIVILCIPIIYVLYLIGKQIDWNIKGWFVDVEQVAQVDLV